MGCYFARRMASPHQRGSASRNWRWRGLGHAGADGCQPSLDRPDLVLPLAADEAQLVERRAVATRHHPQFLPQAPEAEQADAKLAVHPPPLRTAEMPLHRIAEVGRDSPEVGYARFIRRHAPAVVLEFEIKLALRPPPNDPHMAGTGVDGVFGELTDRLQGMRLRVGDDRDRVPLVADLERAGGGGGRGHGMSSPGGWLLVGVLMDRRRSIVAYFPPQNHG